MTEAGLSSYSIIAVGGPNNIKPSGLRFIRSCDPLSITSSVAIAMKQTMMVGDSNINFKAPNYIEIDVNCPAVESIKIYEKNCSTISAEFESSNDLMSSLSNGLLYAKLVNEQAP